MKKFRGILEVIAGDILKNMESGEKPNLDNREFMNCVLIFQNALMDKLYDNQDYDEMPIEDRLLMADQCGKDLRKFIHTYTGLDTHDTELFI